MVPLVREEGSEVVRATKGNRVEVEIEQLDGIKAVELEMVNIDDGGVIEATRVGGGLAGR